MSYQVKLYKNTGFNPENIPASPSVLDSVASAGTVPALEIMQQRYLSGVRVSVSWDEVKDVDYCKIGDEYYFVGEGIHMVASDVAYLPLSLDPITSIGGVSNIKVLDGQTERYSGVSVGSGSDPLLAPKNTMDIEGGWILGDTAGTEYVECTLSPGATATNMNAMTYTAPDTNEQVSVPQARSCNTQTIFEDVTGNKNLRGTCLYDSTNEATKRNIATLRSLGLEGSIISHVRYPVSMVDITTGGEAHDGQTEPIAGKVKGTIVTQVQLPISEDIANGYDNAAHINNSDFAKLGLVSCDGSSVEFVPADIDISQGVMRITDPNPDGRPFFRFRKYKGDSSIGGFWKNAIGGMKWKNIPLKFVEASGTAISRIKTDNELTIDASAREYNRIKAVIDGVLRTVSFGTSIASGSSLATGRRSVDGGRMHQSLSSSAYGNDGSSASFNSGSPISAITNLFDNAFNNQIAQRKAITDFAVGTVQVPQLSFPYEAETLRDVNGNGVYCYRYKYSAADLARIDKLITRYGKKYVAALTEDMLVPGANDNFVFIQCNGVSVTHKTQAGRSSNWLNQAIAGQLEGGIRIWNVAPTAGTV